MLMNLVEIETLQPTLHTCHSRNCQDRIADYAAGYGNLFKRVDQREWFELYISGLLNAPARKNVESIATAVGLRSQKGANLSQALQHFVSQSPWDYSRILSRYRELLPPEFREEALAWVIHDGVLLKKGRNSVGTQRQMARPIKRKVNCQIAVVVGLQSKVGYAPLHTQLYLPKYWLRQNDELVEKTVPSDQRQHVPKHSIALSLLGELRDEGWPVLPVVAEEGYRTAESFAETLAKQGLQPVDDENYFLSKAGERFEWLKSRLGLDHFEGRTWIGWHHHAAMVFAAAGFLLTRSCNSEQ
jgi:SRSO17 transposase